MLAKIKEELSETNTSLVAVSKTRSNSQILDIYNQGHRLFGENRVPELVEKYESLPQDIQWHAIGTLQTNKVKYIAPFISLIHSVDSVKLLDKINSEAKKNDRVIDVLLQIKIGMEEAKHGFEMAFLEKELTSKNIGDAYANVQIVGLMGMASFVDDESQVSKEFSSLKTFFDTCQSKFFTPETFNTLSMGMSGDYKIAVVEGSTMVRIGSLLFS